MTTNSRFVTPYASFFDAAGVPRSGAKLYFWFSGTDTPAPIYSSASGGVTANPATANAAGQFGNIFTDPAISYKVSLFNVDPVSGVETLVWTADPLGASSGVAPNYAALRANGAPTSIVYVEGRLTEGDGGQGWFVLDPADTTSADNGGTILVAGSARWKRLNANPLYAEWFGAAPSPADSTAGLQAAMDVGGYIQLNAVQYDYTALSIQTPVRLVGALCSREQPQTILNCTVAGATTKLSVGGLGFYLDGVTLEQLLLIAPNASLGTMVVLDQLSNFLMSNVLMDSIGQTQYGVVAQQLSVARFDNVQIVSPTGAGFRIVGDDTTTSRAIEFMSTVVSGDSTGAQAYLPNAYEFDGAIDLISGESVYAINCGRGLLSHNSVGATVRATGIAIHDFVVESPNNEAVRIEHHDEVFLTSAKLSGSLINANVALVAPSKNITFLGGYVAGAFTSGVLSAATNVRLVGVDIIDNSVAGAGMHPGLSLLAASRSTAVTGCLISGALQSYGVSIADGAATYLVTGNDLRGNATGPLLDASASWPADSTRASAPNLGQIGSQGFVANAAGDAFTITFGRYETLTIPGSVGLATGTITMAADPVHGQEARVWSSVAVAALTVAANAGQTIDADANITALAGDDGFTLKYDAPSATWYRVG